MSQSHYIYCALYFHYHYISSTSDHQALEAGDPCSRLGPSITARGLSLPDKDHLPESLTHLEIWDISIIASGETEPMNVMHLDKPQ